MTFVRFVVGTPQETPRLQTGVVTELRLLKESGDLPAYEHEHVEALFDWLNTHLPCPPFEGSNWPATAVSWFKSSAQPFIAHFREMIASSKSTTALCEC